MSTNHVHISFHNSKLGAGIPSVNLPVGCTCRPDAPCFKKCYARRGRFSFARNRALLESNLAIWRNDPERYEDDILHTAYFHNFFRWHASGDIPDMDYLKMMVRVAQRLPKVHFLAFTKKYELVNDYISHKGSLPENLTIVFSAWGTFLPKNPFNLPVAYIHFKREPAPIPPNARSCPSYCGDCVASGMSCWDLKPGECVAFNEH